MLQPLEPTEVVALQAALPARYRVAVALGAGVGLRFGEATGLTVPRVYRDLHRIQVLQQAQNNALAPLKTQASMRAVPVGEWVLDEIAEHLERFGLGPYQLVMSTAYGGFVHRNAFGEMWRRAVRLARTCGKPPTDPEEHDRRCADTCADPRHMITPGTRFHDLRHFYASALKMSDVASDASFCRSRERVLAAVQRAALKQFRNLGTPCTVRDLGCHHPLALGRTMMQPVRLQQTPA